MRKQIKLPDSKIISENLSYIKGNQKNNSQISGILIKEQHYLCAYTETYFNSTSSYEIDHFDPTLKDTAQDGYNNWFLIERKWNNRKGAAKRWAEHHQVLLPTDKDFEKRIVFEIKEDEIPNYYPATEGDLEARNTIKYLMLNNDGLGEQRKKYLNHFIQDAKRFNMTYQEYADLLLEERRESLFFIRMLEEALNIKINF